MARRRCAHAARSCWVVHGVSDRAGVGTDIGIRLTRRPRSHFSDEVLAEELVLSDFASNLDTFDHEAFIVMIFILEVLEVNERLRGGIGIGQ